LTPGNERITYNPQPQASAGGAFSVNAPTAPDEWNRSFIRPSVNRTWPAYTYRHGNGSELGLAVSYFDGHADRMSEQQSRHPDPWWPKGTVLPRGEMNRSTYMLVVRQLDDKQRYHVRR
ncbi:MAG: hypothetical protein GY842_28020, partial [bacterium]|nr:hypothetical protein [bacterium]